MKCKLLILTSIATFGIWFNPTILSITNNDNHSRDTKINYVKTQDYIPYFDFKNKYNEEIKNLDISSLDEMDIINLNYQLIFDKQLFSFGLSHEAETDFVPNSLIKFYLDAYYENNEYDRFIFDYIKEIKIVKYPTIGTARLQFILKPNQKIKMRVINEEGQYLNKIYLLEDSFSFSIVNFNTNKEVMVNNEVIDISTTNLSSKLASEVKSKDIIDNLFQFGDEPLITNPLFITNYNREDFLRVFELSIDELKYSNLNRNLSGRITLTPHSSNNSRTIAPFVGGSFEFTLIGFKPNVIVNQVTTNINISSNINFRKMTASEFELGKYSNHYIERFLSSFINYADTPILQNVLIQTSLTHDEFNYVLNPEFVVGLVDDINGKILDNKIIYKIPINNDGTIFEEKTIIFNIIGFKKNISIKMNDLKEIVVNKVFNNLSVNEIDDDFIINNLFQFESISLSENYIGCCNTTIDGFKQYAIKSIEINEKNTIEGYAIISVIFNDNITINNSNSKVFTYKISGFKKMINIYYSDNIIDITNKYNLDKYIFLKNEVFKQNENIILIEQYINNNLETILSQLFTFNFDNISPTNLFSSNANKSIITKTFNEVHVISNKVLGYIDIVFGQNRPVNGVMINGLMNAKEFKLRIIGYEKSFLASFNNKKYIDQNNIPSISIDNLNSNNILDSELFCFENKNQSTNNIITTSISKQVFIDEFLKSISIENEDALGTIYIELNFNKGFINNLDKLWICIYGYKKNDNNFINVKNIDDIGKINEYKGYKAKDFTKENILKLINYKNTNKKFSVLDINCSKQMFDNVILQSIDINNKSNMVSISFHLNEKGENKTYNAYIKGFVEDINYPLIISLSVFVPIITILIVTLVIYLYKKRKLIKEVENE